MLILVLTTIIGFLTPGYLECVHPPYLQHTNILNAVLVGTLRLLAFIVTISVSIYVLVVNRRLAKTVPAQVNVQLPALVGGIEPQDNTVDSTGSSGETYIEMLTKIKMSNVLMMTYMLTNVPITIISMISSVCRLVEGKCGDFGVYFKVIVFCKFICIFFSGMIILRKILRKI